MTYYAQIELTLYRKDFVYRFIGDDEAKIHLLHIAFRKSPEFHRLCTEALLTFDTEAGGQPIDTTTPAPEPEKEEQP